MQQLTAALQVLLLDTVTNFNKFPELYHVLLLLLPM
jgi:hypothetical protein